MLLIINCHIYIWQAGMIWKMGLHHKLTAAAQIPPPLTADFKYSHPSQYR